MRYYDSDVTFYRAPGRITEEKQKANRKRMAEAFKKAREQSPNVK